MRMHQHARCLQLLPAWAQASPGHAESWRALQKQAVPVLPARKWVRRRASTIITGTGGRLPCLPVYLPPPVSPSFSLPPYLPTSLSAILPVCLPACLLIYASARHINNFLTSQPFVCQPKRCQSLVSHCLCFFIFLSFFPSFSLPVRPFPALSTSSISHI